jgi:hypothetical protein
MYSTFAKHGDNLMVKEEIYQFLRCCNSQTLTLMRTHVYGSNDNEINSLRDSSKLI